MEYVHFYVMFCIQCLRHPRKMKKRLEKCDNPTFSPHLTSLLGNYCRTGQYFPLYHTILLSVVRYFPKCQLLVHLS